MRAKIGWLHKYRIAPTAMQLGSLNQFMIYTDTSYATQCRYLCNSVHCVKICFLLHAHKFRMTGMCDERKWIGMHGNKKILFKCRRSLRLARPPSPSEMAAPRASAGADHRRRARMGSRRRRASLWPLAPPQATAGARASGAAVAARALGNRHRRARWAPSLVRQDGGVKK
jgi:hypothetical protein